MPANIWETLSLIQHAEKGSWPILAGTLDQSQSFLDAMIFTRGEFNDIEKEMSGHG